MTHGGEGSEDGVGDGVRMGSLMTVFLNAKRNCGLEEGGMLPCPDNPEGLPAVALPCPDGS